jgi:YihY family inner membrane protein
MSSQTKKPHKITRCITQLDTYQQQHKLPAFCHAVVKKYSEDEANYQAALIAYYGFLSLFPLLIVATVVIQIVGDNDATLREQFLRNATSYFPALGQNLANSIHTPSKTGLALFIAIVIALYGARGVADAVQHALNHVWAVPRARRSGFPRAMIRNFGIIAYAGFGFLIAAALNAYAAGASHAMILRIVLGVAGFMALFGVFWGVFTFGSSARRRPLANIPGALFAATGLLVLQAIGGYIVSHQLKSQNGLTAQFAAVLALLFWLYLQAQVFLYAVEINTVRVHKLWPRSINPKPPLPADEKAYALYRKRETFIDDERLHH